ncbi:MAG: S41 family peptidase [Pseudomonadota bacterium]
MGPQFDKRGKIYALQLTEDANFPFRAKDELDFNKPKLKKDEGDGENGDAEKKAKSEPEIIFEGLSKRLWTVPAAQNNYSALRANGGFIYAFVPAPNGQSSIKSIQINDTKRDIKTFATGVRRFDISNDGKTLFVYRGTGSRPTLALVPAKATMPKDLKGMTLRVGDWRLNISPQAEWSQMIRDAWRLHRDFAFDPNLRGVDWDAVGDQYIPLVERVGHRSELADLMGQMTANLGILHSQVGAGELPRDNEGAVIASLGAEYTPVSGGLQIASIYQSEADRPETLGPLLRPGVDIRVGDVLTAVDGVTVADEADLYSALSHKAGQQIRVDYTRADESLSEIVVPAGGRQAFFMRYYHWVEMNRRKVAEASEGKIGYLHLRAMGGGDVASFARDFYEHFDKDGIIIDVRGNNGGNIDSWILQTLLRQAWAFWQNPNGGEAYPNMQQVFRGHLAVLINEGTYSDGETFSAGVKALDLGPLIGTRTAGAGIWLSDRNRLVDGGIARVAEYPQFGLDGRWLVEGYGVEPDIEVVNPPNASFKGDDAQLDAAMAYLEEQMETNPIQDLVPGPIPPVGETGKDVE